MPLNNEASLQNPTHSKFEWDSSNERRSVPIHLLNFMADQVAIHSRTTNELFEAHTRDEMERYAEILALIAKSNADSDTRHKLLLKSVDDHMATTSAVHKALIQAFPIKKNGEPDFDGHAAAHEHWIQEAANSRELFAYVKKVVLAAAVSVVGAWVISLMWQGVLHGPLK